MKYSEAKRILIEGSWHDFHPIVTKLKDVKTVESLHTLEKKNKNRKIVLQRLRGRIYALRRVEIRKETDRL